MICHYCTAKGYAANRLKQCVRCGSKRIEHEKARGFPWAGFTAKVKRESQP